MHPARIILIPPHISAAVRALIITTTTPSCMHACTGHHPQQSPNNQHQPPGGPVPHTHNLQSISRRIPPHKRSQVYTAGRGAHACTPQLPSQQQRQQLHRISSFLNQTQEAARTAAPSIPQAHAEQQLQVYAGLASLPVHHPTAASITQPCLAALLRPAALPG